MYRAFCSQPSLSAHFYNRSLETSAMDKETESLGTPGRPGYADLPGLPSDATRNGKLVLNRHSTMLTRDHDFPGAKVLHKTLSLDVTG